MADRMSALFARASRPRNAYALVAAVAIGYSLVAFELARANALPMPDPFLRIPDEQYFQWGGWFYAPVIVGSWLLTSAVIFALGRGLGVTAPFERLLPATALAVGLGTLGTLVPDLVTSPLRMVGVIHEPSWERSIAELGGWFWFTWATLAVYITIFVIAFPVAIRRALGLRWRFAVPLGVIGFAVFQGFEYVFIR